MAQSLLDEQGEFYPFGAIIDNNQEVTYIGASNEDEYPSSHDLISLLDEAFRKELDNDAYSLCAICYDVYLKETVNNIEYKKSAVRVEFIGDNYTNKISIPYKTDEQKGIIFQ